MMSTPRRTPRKQIKSPQRRSPLPAPKKTPLKTNSTPNKPNPTPTKSNGCTEEGITVAVRMRPLNQNEGSHQRVWKVLPKYSSVTQTTRNGQPLPERVSGRTFFTFDKTFNEKVSTTEVYDSVAKDIVSSVVSGLNGTIFAYGQTSSGKTYTMQGSGSIKEGSMGGSGGIVHMAANDIFNNISETEDRVFLVRASFLEIYNEEVRDLLSTNSPTLQIREDPRRGVFVQSKEEIVADFDALLAILFQGENNRAFASTAMNERSSRSHTIFRVTIESRKKGITDAGGGGDDEDTKENHVPSDDGAVLISTLNLVDLAGSESVRHTGATGERQKEGGMINTSLLTLSRVIVALGCPNQTHINFRDSKLTRILQPSLSGNARMAIICCATPSELYLEETRSTLLFASRAKLVKTRAQVNEVLDDRSIIRRLQRELAEARRNGPGSAQSKQIKALELKADAAGGAARAAEDSLYRLKKSILNGGALFGCKSERPLGLSSLDSDYPHENEHSMEPRKGKRRYSEGGLKIGRLTGTPTRSTTKAFPHTGQKEDKPEDTSASELHLLREALVTKNNLIKQLNSELTGSKELVLAKDAELIESKHLLRAKDTEIAASNASIAELQCVNIQLQAKREESKEQVRAIEAEMAAYNASIAELQGSKNDAFRELQAMTSIHAETLSKLRDQESKSNEQENALLDALADLNRTKVNENVLSTQLEKEKSERQTLEEALLAKNTKSNETETALADTLNELERSKSDCSDLVKVLNETLLEKNDMVQRLQCEKVELEDSFQYLRSQYETLEQQKSGAQQQLQQLRNTHEATTLKLTQIEAEMNQLIAVCAEKEHEHLSLLEKVEASHRESERKVETIAQLETLLCDSSAENKVLVCQNEERKDEIQNLQNDKLSVETALNKKLKTALSTKEVLEVEKAKMQTKLEIMEANVRSLSLRVEVLNFDLVASTKQISQLEAKCKVSAETSNDVKEELLGAQNAVANFRATLEANKAALSTLAKDLDNVITEVGRHEDQMIPLSSSHDCVAQQAEKLASAIAGINFNQQGFNHADEALATTISLELQIACIEEYLSRSEAELKIIQGSFTMEKGVLESRLVASSVEKSALALSLETAEERLASIQNHAVARHEEAKYQLETLQQLVDADAYEKSRLSSELKSLKGENEDHQSTIQTLRTRIQDLIKEREAAKNGGNSLSASLQEAESRLVLLEEHIGKEALNREQMSLELATITKKFDAASNAKKEAENAVQTFQASQKGFQSLIVSLRTSNAALVSKNGKAQAELELQSDKIGELELLIETNTKSLESSMERITAFKTKKEALEEKLVRVMHENELTSISHNAALKESESQNSLLKEKLDTFSVVKDELEATLQEALNEKIALESELESAVNEIEIMGARISEIEASSQETRTTLATAVGRAELLETEKQELMALRYELSKELEDAKSKEKALELLLLDTGNQVPELEGDLALALKDKAEFETKAFAVSAKLAEVSQSRDEALCAIMRLQAKHENCEVILLGLSGAKELVQAQAQGGSEEIQSLKWTIEELEGALSKHGAILDTQSQCTEAIRMEKEMIEKHITSLEAEKSRVGLARDVLANDLKVTETRAQLLKDELTKANETEENGISQLWMLREDLVQAMQDYNEASAALNALRLTYLNTLESLKQAKAEKATLDSQLEERTAQMTELIEGGDSCAEELSAATKELALVVAQNSAAVESLNQTKDEKTHLTVEVANGESQLGVMTETIDELTEAVENGQKLLGSKTVQLDQLESDRSDAMQAFDRLTKEQTLLETELGSSAWKLDKIATIIGELTVLTEAGQTSINETEEQLTLVQSEKACLHQELQLCRQRHEEAVCTAKQMVAKSGEEAETKVQALRDAETKMQALNDKLEKQQATSTQALLDLELTSSELRKTCQLHEEAIAEMELFRQKHSKFEAVVDNLSCSKVALVAENGSVAVAELQLLSSRISELELANESHQSLLTEQIKIIADLKAQQATLKTELHLLRVELDEADSAKNAHAPTSSLVRLQEDFNPVRKSRGDLDEKLKALRCQIAEVQRERDDAATAFQSLQLRHEKAVTESKNVITQLSADKDALGATVQSLQTTIEHGRGNFAATTKKLELDNTELQGRLSSAGQNLAIAIVERDANRNKLKKADSKILGLQAEILQLRSSQAEHTSEMLQEARNAAIAADDELHEKEKELKEVQCRLTQCEEELKALFEESQLYANQKSSDAEFVVKYDKLRADYLRALEAIEEEKTGREESEKELKQTMGEEQRHLIQEAQGRMDKLKTSMDEVKKKLMDSEAENYAAREANEKYRGHAKRCEKEMQHMKSNVAALEEKTRELTTTLREQEKQSNAEVTRLVSSINTCKAELYASKQIIMDLNERLQMAVAAEENAVREMRLSQEKAIGLESQVQKTEKKYKTTEKDLQQLRANIENQVPTDQKLLSEIHELNKKLSRKDEAIRKLESFALGEGGDEKLVTEIGKLKEVLTAKEERIKKLKSVALSKDQCRNLKKLKEEHAAYIKLVEKAEGEKAQLLADNDALEKELASLRSQLEGGGAEEGDRALENQRLRFDKQALEKKLRKFASHCQSLEDDNVRIVDVLQSTFSGNINTSDIPGHVVALCDEHTGLQNKCRALNQKLQGQKCSLARTKELECVVAALRKEAEELRQKLAEEEGFKVAYLEKENLQLMEDLQLMQQQLKHAKVEVSNLRLACLQDSPPAIQHSSSDSCVQPLPSSSYFQHSKMPSSDASVRKTTSVQSFDASESSSKKRSAVMTGEKTPKRSRFLRLAGGSSRKPRESSKSTKLPGKSRNLTKENNLTSGTTPGLGQADSNAQDQPAECHQS